MAQQVQVPLPGKVRCVPAATGYSAFDDTEFLIAYRTTQLIHDLCVHTQRVAYTFMEPYTGGKELASKESGEHARNFVTVLEVQDSFALRLAKASLDEAGIDYVVSGEDPGYLPGFHGSSGIGTTPLWKCSFRIQVAPESESAARALLEPLQQ